MKVNTVIVTNTVIEIVAKIGRELVGRTVDCHEQKARRDFVTNVDKETEQTLKNLLFKNFPDYEFCGEESFVQGNSINPEVPTWIVDPLDGTSNFISGIPIVAISVALWHKGGPLLGVIYDVYNYQMYSAQKGEGACLWNIPRSDYPMLTVSSTAKLQDSMLAFDFPNMDKRRQLIIHPMMNIVQQAKGVRIFGCAALALCWLASGILDGYVNFQLYLWDIAAGQLILEEAGGKLDIVLPGAEGSALLGIIASNGKIQPELLFNLDLSI